jgi:hypothetical protein
MIKGEGPEEPGKLPPLERFTRALSRLLISRVPGSEGKDKENLSASEHPTQEVRAHPVDERTGYDSLL